MTTGEYEGCTVYLYSIPHYRLMDSAVVQKQTFEFNLPDSLALYELQVKKEKADFYYITLPLVAGEGDVKVAMGEKVTTWGTPSNDRLQDFLLSVENFYIENVKAKKTQQEMVEGFRVFLQKQDNANLHSPVSAYILATYRSRFIAEDYTLFKNKIVADYRKLLE